MKDRVTANTMGNSYAAPSLFSIGDDTDDLGDGSGDITDERIALVDNEEIASAPIAPSVSADQQERVHDNPWGEEVDHSETTNSRAGPSGEPQKLVVGKVSPTTTRR